ncbi:MAG: helix-turn-helix transcriptional regulator [Clostridia bacterium]|nr:helix-turn-helix transcriptional regulator [Clostridia bacterium]
MRDLIKNRKITQAGLAKKAGLSNSALIRYLQGAVRRTRAMVSSYGSPGIMDSSRLPSVLPLSAGKPYHTPPKYISGRGRR